MAPTIYWQPMGVGTVRALALDFLTGYREAVETDASTAETLGGTLQRQVWGQRRRVSLTRASISGLETSAASMLRALRALDAHLQAGHSIAFSLAPTKAALHFAPSPPPQGSTVIQRGGNALTFLGAGGSLGIGDEVVIESYALPRTVERGVLTAVSPAFTVSSGLVYRHHAPVIVRHPETFVGLKQAEPAAILIDAGPDLYDLELDLVEDVGEVLALQGTGIQLATATAAGASLGARAHLASVAALSAPDGRT